MTNHHKRRDLEQHKLIISRFWKSEVGNACHWAKIKCWQAALLIRGLEKNLFSGLLQLLEGTLIPWHMILLHLQSQQLQPYNHFHHHIFSNSPAPSSQGRGHEYLWWEPLFCLSHHPTRHFCRKLPITMKKKQLKC